MADEETGNRGNKKDNLSSLTSGTVPAAENKSQSVAVEDVGLDLLAPAKKGTYMSFLLMIVGIVLSIVTYRYSKDFTSQAFTDYCGDSDYEDSCKANSAVLRVSLALTVLFVIQMIGTFIFTPFFDQLWLVKFCAFIALVVGFFFAHGRSFGTDGYAWFARITGFFYLILQQIILIDMAYSWNESWINRSTSADGERGWYWLAGLIVISFLFFGGALSVIGVLYWQFDACENNVTIISVTLGLTVFATMVQLFFTDEGNLITSSIVMLYSTYVCYSAVTLNPSETCNPTLQTGYQTLSSIIGIVLTVISLLWTTFNTVKNIPQVTDRETGAAVTLDNVTGKGAPGEITPSSYAEMPKMNSLLVQVSFVFMLSAGYYAMVLTNWATEQSSASINNSRIGTSAMWIQASGSWIAVAIYLWTLIAPKLFPNREF